MSQILLFLGFTFAVMTVMIFTEWKKKISFPSLIGLFIFGVLLSIPFVMIEYLGSHMKYYFVILAFIAIELGVIVLEHKVKYFHDLIHHNVKDLRIISFFLIGLGFTYSELSFYIFHTTENMAGILHMIPLKTGYALFMHTVLTAAMSIVSAARFVAEGVMETIIHFISYYARIAIVSTSHYLYIFFSEHENYLIVPFLAISVIAFFKIKNYLDNRHEKKMKVMA